MELKQSKDQTLLEVLEAGGASPHAHCRTGYCGMCRTKVNPEDIKNIKEVGDALGYHDHTSEVLACVSSVGEGKVDLVVNSTNKQIRIVHEDSVNILTGIDVPKLSKNIDDKFRVGQSAALVAS